MSAEEIDAIDDVYKKQAEKDYEEAIAASLKEEEDFKKAMEASIPKSRINKPVGNAAANKTAKNKHIDPLQNRISTSKTRKNIIDARIAAMDIGPVVLGKCRVDIVPGDGDCFFTVVARQLTSYGFNVIDTDEPTATPQKVIRNKIAKHIRNFYSEDESGIWSLPDPTNTRKDIQLEPQTYAGEIQTRAWAGANEMRFIIEGALSDITENRGFIIEVYERDTHGGFKYHYQFSQAIEGLTTSLTDKNERLVLRFLYKEPLHYDSILCEDQAGLVNDTSAQGNSNLEWECSVCSLRNNPNTDICELCETYKNTKKEPVSIYKHNIVQNVEVFGYVNGAGIDYKQNNNKINDAHVIKITPEIRQMFEAINAANTRNMNSKNLDDLGQWTEESQKVVAFVPKDEKRPPPATVKNEDNTNKTFINVFIHDWVCFGTEPNESNTITKYPFLKLEDSNGIEETLGNNIDIYPVTREWTQLEYQIHNLDNDPASYSPDTGIIVLDDNFDGNPSCKITCVDVLTKRILRVELIFFRDENTYKNQVSLKIGGKPRRTRKLRKHRKRQTKRRR